MKGGLTASCLRRMRGNVQTHGDGVTLPDQWLSANRGAQSAINSATLT